MAVPKAWQQGMVRDLTALVESDPEVPALVVFGSCARGGVDLWSDVDALLVVEDAALDRYFPSLEWLCPLGDFYTYDQSSDELSRTTRMCLRDLRRLDLVVQTEAMLSRAAAMGRTPLAHGARVVFSRSAVVDRVLASPPEPLPPALISAEQFEEMSRRFWFRGVVAVERAARRDLPVALDLALRMAQDCLLLLMLLRDRATGTDRHRGDSAWNHRLAALTALQCPCTAPGILAMLEGLSVLYDGLCAEWSPGCEERRHPLLELIRAAEESVGPAG